ncbi:MAG: helix-turn-helix domain-containing protein [Acidobacteriota bacterium]|nr:helix-turn-helix domain-containing protein [Acidobacteriota bacterium]
MNDEQNIVVENDLLRRGFTSIPNYIFGLPISSNAKLIYMALLSYAWTNQSCYPGLAKLCSDVSLSDKPVTKAIEELSASQLLEVKRRGQGKTNIYIIKDFTSLEREPKSSDSRIGESPIQESEILRN